MKIVLTFFLTMVLLISCKKDKESNEITACNVHDPLRDLPWLAALKQPCEENAICSVSIFQGIYNGETVFYTFLSGPLCDPAFYVALLDCNGATIKEYYWDNYPQFEQEVDSVKTIYSCWE
jgi:hypothetical protein